MKKQGILLVVAVFCLMCAVPAYALLDDNSTNLGQAQGQAQGINDSGNATQGQVQGNVGINDQSQSIRNSGNSDNRNTNTNLLGQDLRNTNDLSNRNTNLNGQDQDQKQGQGQDQGQGQGQAMGQSTGIDISDDSDYKSYSFSPPAIHAQKGTETGNMYSIFGGVGLSQTEEYTVGIEKLATIERMLGAGFVSKEWAIAEANAIYKDIDSASQPKRWLGIFGKTRGRHLLNVFGLLAWDSWYQKGQAPFSKSGPWGSGEKKVKEVSDPDVNDGSGNEGYVN
jgi:hypothetical protein